jgi:hypothetical protein
MNIQMALRKKKELNMRLLTLESRVCANVIYEEGKPPLYDDNAFEKMREDVLHLRHSIRNLQNAIDAANHVKNKRGISVYCLITYKNSLVAELNHLTILRATRSETYGMRENPVFKKRISDPELDTKIDELTEERRRIDDEICETNASISVEES